MSRDTIKWLAIAAMVVDHVGLFLLPDFVLLRFVGRLAMPLFCCLVALGAVGSSRPKRYFGLLLLFAIISEPVSAWVFGTMPLNVLFTLALGMLSVRRLWLLPLCIVASFATEYGAPAVLLIWTLSVWLRGYGVVWLAAACVCTTLLNVGAFADVIALTALALFIAQRMGRLSELPWTLPRTGRVFFYWFYPVHLSAIFALSLALYGA